MRRNFALLSSIVLASAVLAGCPSGGGSTGGGGTTTTTGGGKEPSGELDKLMRTRMNTSYSQLVYLVFHADGEPNFDAINEEGSKLSEAISSVLQLQLPSMVKSEQGRQVYVDYNETMRRDNLKFVEATARRDIQAMGTSLTKIGETCSACHHFFRVEIEPAK